MVTRQLGWVCSEAAAREGSGDRARGRWEAGGYGMQGGKPWPSGLIPSDAEDYKERGRAG